MADDGRGPREWLRWFLTTDEGVVLYVREVLSSVAAVLLVGLVLFAISGVWPPMVAIESSSMHPNMQKGDLVFVMEEQRLSPSYAHVETGVVTYRIGHDHGYTKFNAPGDVVIYRKDGQTGTTPIIHRARFWVNDSENWYDKARSEHIAGAESCMELRNCPAPHAGFITKGDANQRYDQVSGLSSPVKPAWVVGTAELRVPYLGYVKLVASGAGHPLQTTVAAHPTAPTPADSMARNTPVTVRSRIAGV